MRLSNSKNIFYIIIISGVTAQQETKQFVICSSSFPQGSEDEILLDCGPDAIIDVQFANVAHYFDGPPCTSENIFPWMIGLSQSSCKLITGLPL